MSDPFAFEVPIFDADGDVTVQAPAWGTWTHQPSPEWHGRVLFCNAVRAPGV